MVQISKIICFIVLCSFTFTTSAASLLCSLSMSDKAESQQNSVDLMSESCHSDQHQTDNESSGDCCHDMNSCGVSISLVSNVSLIQIQISHSSVQLSSNDHLVFNSFSPPVPPPKLIN